MKANSFAVLGLQWGDEGKGKIIDFLSESCDAVARFGGGSNAGHTIVVAGEKFILRLLPSGILHPGKPCYIGAGVATDPEVLASEITALAKRGISVSGRLFVDFASHLVTPLHKVRDNFEEGCRGKGAIDTTKRGIGPSYADRVTRIGIRVADLFDNDLLQTKAENLVRFHSYCAEDGELIFEEECQKLMDYLLAFRPLLDGIRADVGLRIMDLLAAGKSILFEGAQGSLLDVDFGTYPYTTSCHTTVGGIFTGLGIPPASLGNVIGVMKSYMTRVGKGPFPTEIKDDLSEILRKKGAEFGSVTGRPRRIGWLDMVSLNRMIRQNGVNRLAVTKLDILDGIPEILICESYESASGNGHTPPNSPEFFNVVPKYTRMAGWLQPLAGKKKLADFPSQARAYLDFIEEKTGVPIWLISTGFSREDTILKEL